MNEVKRFMHSDQRGSIEVQRGKYVLYEDYAALMQQLTATTNSLTNAQEALKSAGIEADTVQAGVMELKAQGDALAAENAALKTFIKQSCYSYDGDGSDVCDSYVGADESPFFPKTPATDAYLNAVRAEGVDKAIEHLHNKFTSTGHVGVPVMALEWLAAQLRAGNAGKDGV